MGTQVVDAADPIAGEVAVVPVVAREQRADRVFVVHDELRAIVQRHLGAHAEQEALEVDGDPRGREHAAVEERPLLDGQIVQSTPKLVLPLDRELAVGEDVHEVLGVLAGGEISLGGLDDAANVREHVLGHERAGCAEHVELRANAAREVLGAHLLDDLEVHLPHVARIRAAHEHVDLRRFPVLTARLSHAHRVARPRCVIQPRIPRRGAKEGLR